MKKILFVLGTRPEAIKLAPLFLEMKQHPKDFEVKMCSTGQHREMLDQVFDFFSIKPDYELNIMKPNQTLSGVTQLILQKLDAVIDDFKPDMIMVQGDTTTVLAGALGAFYRGIEIIHIEAGLRTWDIHTPFPEEANRVLVAKIADYHFAPTQIARDNLIKDNTPKEKIFIVGNTVTDAILKASSIVEEMPEIKQKFADIDFFKKIILLTSHRRENLGEGLNNICQAVAQIAQRDDVEIIFPVHLNPKVQETVKKYLSNFKNVYLFEPFEYPYLVWVMKQSHLILTDSGGIQEEAPTLGKPVLVMRESTERPEGVMAGTAKLVGTNKQLIIETTNNLLDDDDFYNQMAQAINPYGDGHCCEKIIKILINQ